MQTDIQSHNSTSTIGATNKQLLLPSGSQILLYFLISILILTTLNLDKAWNYLNQVVLVPQGGLDSLIAKNAPGLHKFLNYISQSVLLQVIFWIGVGCVVYVLIWFAKNIFINIRNDMVADNYVHPASYKRSSYWESVVARKIFFWVSLLVLLFFVISGTRLVVYLSDLCYLMVSEFHAKHSVFVISKSVLATTGFIYVLVLLIHLTVNSWRLMYKDL